MRTVSPGEQFVKVIYDKMVQLLGDQKQDLALLLGAGHQVSVLDLPGHGIRFEDPLYIGLAEYRYAVTGLLDNCVEPAILVDHSMGGVALSIVM